MKFVKMLLTPPIMAISATLTLSASAANRFVSADGTWKMKDESGQEMAGGLRVARPIIASICVMCVGMTAPTTEVAVR